MRQTGGGAASVGAAGRIRALRAPLDPAQMALLLALLGLLTAFILYPLIQVLAVAFTADGRLSLVHLRNFFARPLFREALGGSLLAGFLAVLFGSLLGVPLAYFSVRLQFRGRLPSSRRWASCRSSSRPSWGPSPFSRSWGGAAWSTCSCSSASASRCPSWTG